MIKLKEYSKRIIERLGYNPNKSIVYQNLQYFLYPSFTVEKINPNHKAILYGIKKRRYSKSQNRHFERIAFLVKSLILFLLFGITFVFFMFILQNPNMLYGISNGMYNIALGIPIFLTFIILHETLHIEVFRHFKIPFTVKPLIKNKIPIGIAVYSDYFRGKVKDFTKTKKLQYTIIAFMPYFFIFPLCILYMQYNIFFYVIGLSLLISHMINLPLEFVFVEDD